MKYKEGLRVNSKVELNKEEIKNVEKEEGFKILTSEFIEKKNDTYVYDLLVEWQQ